MLAGKRLLLVLLAALLGIFSFAGCGDHDNAASKSSDSSQSAFNAEAPDGTNDLPGELKVSFLDVGQGDAIFLELPNKQTMLIDAGNPDDGANISRYIKNAGYEEIDYIVATHPHDDHIGGMPEIIRNFKIDYIYMPKVSNNTASFENLLTEVEHKDYTIKTAKSGVNIIEDGDLNIDILAPVKDSYEDLNNYSAVVRLDYGSSSFLFMGDAEKLSENQIKGDVNADVLKVGHHGSDYSSSTSFIERVSPEYAVISVGKENDYGHPSRETLDTLTANKAAIFRTDQAGTIIIKSDGSKITVENMNSNYSILKGTPDSSSYDANSIVYITDTGTKYHRNSCSYLSESSIPIPLSHAVLNYDPCSRCNPPNKEAFV